MLGIARGVRRAGSLFHRYPAPGAIVPVPAIRDERWYRTDRRSSGVLEAYQVDLAAFGQYLMVHRLGCYTLTLVGMARHCRSIVFR